MQFLDIHTHQSKQRKEVLVVQSLSLTESVFLAMPKTKPISIGIHPWYGHLEELDKNMKYLNVLARQANVKLMGECGLDKLRGEPLPNQLEMLKRQVMLAEELQKPLILHCVKAYDELIQLKKALQVKVPMIIHGFNKNAELGQQLLHQGFYLSFGKAILNPASGAAQLLATTSTFFLETDDATDIQIEEIYGAAANLKKCSVDELKARIFADWKKITGSYV